MAPRADIDQLAALLRGKRVVALTGAGMSTESGIPDYRGPTTLRYARERTPIHGPEFARSAATRARYWARAVVGWPAIAAARPNAAHHALVDLERSGAVAGVITQNVDRLHTKAGTRRLVELHGALADVGCLDCANVVPREEVQARLVHANAAWLAARQDAPVRPDGDADLDDAVVASFHVVACAACGGRLKPRVVYFGDNVPRATVDAAFALLAEGDALLVLGSSLAVFSGYRFVLRAAERGLPVAIVNEGETRGDAAASVKLEARLGDALPALARAIG